MFPSSPEASEELPAVYREQRLPSEAPSLPVIVSALICLLVPQTLHAGAQSKDAVPRTQGGAKLPQTPAGRATERSCPGGAACD